MFQVLVIKPNVIDDFKLSLWQEREKVKEFIYSVDTNNLQDALANIFSNDSNENLDLNTVDVLYSKEYTYQLIYNVDDNENYIGSVINYKRKIIKGTCVLVKIRLTDINNNIIYKESPMNLNDEVDYIIKDLFYHTGYKINTEIKEIVYDNKYNLLEDNKMKELNYYEVNLFGIPFRIWYVEGKPTQANTLSYVRDIGLFLNKHISEVYITCSIYNKCKCLSLNVELIKQFIDLVTTYPDEGELKEISVAYNFATKNHRSDNVYIMFNDFYWKVMSNSR